jgi:hypothetical protein
MMMNTSFTRWKSQRSLSSVLTPSHYIKWPSCPAIAENEGGLQTSVKGTDKEISFPVESYPEHCSPINRVIDPDLSVNPVIISVPNQQHKVALTS